VAKVDMTFLLQWRVGVMRSEEGVDSMLQFWLERGGDGMKCCQKIKWRQRTHLGSMGRKRDMVQRRGDIGRRRGITEEGKGRRRRQLG
jgi:hypothetical protein